ncbi:MAG: LON peptidase substrate-binding domain-containing protein [Phycisphaeraceae bacterium]
MPETLTIDFRQPVPLFPLPNCVLLPHATIPLHIFEPRYRAMMSDALDHRGLIAMALFEGDNWKADYEGSPPLRPFVCVGYIVRHQRLDDGRYNLLLQGACRAKIREETPHRPYRKALLEPLERQSPMEIDLGDHRDRIESLLKDPVLAELSSVAAVQNWLSKEIPTNALIDLMTMTMCEDVEQRYGMLIESDVDRRASWLEGWLRETRQTLKTAKRFEPPSLEDRINVN